MLVLSALWFIAVAWLILRAVRQRNVLIRVPPEAPTDPGGAPKIAVIVPARDEGANIGPCVRSLRAQHYPEERLAIIVVDDDSSDETAQIAAAMAAEDRRIKLLETSPLPAGWKGKVHACCTGAAAVAPDVEWLCFLDADMTAEPHALASAVRCAADRGLDLLSLAPRHVLGSFAERLMLPCALVLLAFWQDLRKLQASGSNEALATGQFMLLRRGAYEAVGGHASVRGALSEDVELARLLKRRGYHVLLMDGSQVLSTRMYTGWRTLWPGLARNMIQLFGGPMRTALTAPLIAVLAWTALGLPAWDLAGLVSERASGAWALGLAMLASIALFALYVAGSRHFKIPWWYGLLFPLGYTVGAMMALDSVRWRVTRRVHWKGRVYES